MLLLERLVEGLEIDVRPFAVLPGGNECTFPPTAGRSEMGAKSSAACRVHAGTADSAERYPSVEALEP